MRHFQELWFCYCIFEDLSELSGDKHEIGSPSLIVIFAIKPWAGHSLRFSLSRAIFSSCENALAMNSIDPWLWFSDNFSDKLIGQQYRLTDCQSSRANERRCCISVQSSSQKKTISTGILNVTRVWVAVRMLPRQEIYKKAYRSFRC